MLQDIETGSLWSQVTGKCIAGEMEGSLLTLYPAAMTTFAEFCISHPDGKLLSKPQPGPDSSPYDWYAADTSALSMFGRVDNFQRLRGKDIVYGLRMGGRQVAVAKDHLADRRLVVLEQFALPIIVTGDSAGRSVAAFELPVDRQRLSELKLVGDTLTFVDGGASFNAWTGRILSDEGDDLTPVPITSVYWFAWVSFFPNTELVK